MTPNTLIMRRKSRHPSRDDRTVGGNGNEQRDTNSLRGSWKHTDGNKLSAERKTVSATALFFSLNVNP